MITLIEYWPNLGIGLAAQAIIIKTKLGTTLTILN